MDGALKKWALRQVNNAIEDVLRVEDELDYEDVIDELKWRVYVTLAHLRLIVRTLQEIPDPDDPEDTGLEPEEVLEEMKGSEL